MLTKHGSLLLHWIMNFFQERFDRLKLIKNAKLINSVLAKFCYKSVLHERYLIWNFIKLGLTITTILKLQPYLMMVCNAISLACIVIHLWPSYLFLVCAFYCLCNAFNSFQGFRIKLVNKSSCTREISFCSYMRTLT